MYENQFKILEDILENTSINQIWSIYSLCNHNSEFKTLEECKSILISFIKNLSTIDKFKKEKIELVYLISNDISSNKIIYKLDYESKLSNYEEFYKYDIYGIVKTYKDYKLDELSQPDLPNKNIVIKNDRQFRIECQDIYKNIDSVNLLSENLWFSRYSEILNSDSLLSRYKLTNINNECKTEPYPSNLDITLNKNKLNDNLKIDEISTDPYPDRIILEDKSDLKENTNINNINILKNKKDIKKSENETINLFEDDNDLINDDIVSNSNNSNKINMNNNNNSNLKLSKRRKKLNENNNLIENDKNEYNPLEVEKIIHGKVKKEKMYQDNKTGYLVIEDDVDFIIGKDKKSKNEKSTKRNNKIKKDSNLDNKQQTLNSFFKIKKMN